MSPSKFHHVSDVTKAVINGPRPSPVRINKASHTITKQNGAVSSGKRPPVIIYTESPKVIHTNATEFMGLVQRLTGMSRDHQDRNDKITKPSYESDQESITNEGSISPDDKKCGEVMNIDSNSFYDNDEFVAHDLSVKCRVSNNNNAYMMDAPFFTPNSSDYLCSSSRTNTMYQSPSMANSISPSFMDFNFIKGFPDY